MVVLGYNDLGMHCINQDFSELCLLPPYNNLHAQVIDRSGGEPRIVKSGIQISYSVPGNTVSANKTNFWTYAPLLFGVRLAANIGLTGNGLVGLMTPTGTGDWAATGIPITPVNNAGATNPYQLAAVSVFKQGKLQASTETVIPVSWEISCDLCHKPSPGVSMAGDILARHDRLHGTQLVNQKPVLCAKCHADPALNTPGVPGVSNLSSAMHKAHANRFTPDIISPSVIQNQLHGVKCYACHPGIVTQCQRDVHYAKGITCENCHGSMAAVGDPSRTPWVSEPRCDNCHKRAGFAFEQPGKLFKDSIGHNGVKCSACHGSPHAITPTVTPADNLQAILWQGHAGTINDCTVCHRNRPDDRFNHTAHGD